MTLAPQRASFTEVAHAAPAEAPVASSVRIGTRGSALALIQAHIVEAALRATGVNTEIVVIETAGDRRAPDTPWGEGAFVAAIQEALLDGRVDAAIHSAKDLPTETDPRLTIGAYLRRADPRDCLVTRPTEVVGTLGELPRGARVGTDSPRRTGFLLAKRPDLRLAPLHGNVDTRLRRLDEGQADALVLAVAGLTRLGRRDRIGAILDPMDVPPAPGQGALAVEVRADDHTLLRALRAIDHRPTRTAVEAERAVLRQAGGGCRSPIGALGRVEGRQLRLIAGYATPDGQVSEVLQVRGSAVSPAAMIAALVGRLDASAGVRGAGRARPRVLVTRAAGQAAEVVEGLARVGLHGVSVPAIAIAEVDAAGREALRTAARQADWVVVTSTNGAFAFGALDALAHAANPSAAGAPPARPRWAAVGEATASVLRSLGAAAVWLPREANARSLARELPIQRGARVLLARTPRAGTDLARQLRARGATVTELDAYRTYLAPESSRRPLRDALTGPGGIAALTFLSASAVDGLLELTGPELAARCRALPAICIGPGTARIAAERGFANVLTADVRSVDGVAAMTAASVTAAGTGVRP